MAEALETLGLVRHKRPQVAAYLSGPNWSSRRAGLKRVSVRRHSRATARARVMAAILPRCAFPERVAQCTWTRGESDAMTERRARSRWGWREVPCSRRQGGTHGSSYAGGEGWVLSPNERSERKTRGRQTHPIPKRGPVERQYVAIDLHRLRSLIVREDEGGNRVVYLGVARRLRYGLDPNLLSTLDAVTYEVGRWPPPWPPGPKGRPASCPSTSCAGWPTRRTGPR
jgi:hypothetical protein